ncbi:hypothetical protein CPC08DRAFT_194761 [Agrocybe pediades]|nr:hypothetical protein CPC08DRAFT_194761 [Agrocybe pediades]
MTPCRSPSNFIDVGFSGLNKIIISGYFNVIIPSSSGFTFLVSLGSLMISSIIPLVPFATFASTAKLIWTIAFIPIAICTYCSSFPVCLSFISAMANRASIVKPPSLSLSTSSALTMYLACLVSLQCFSTAYVFHTSRTPCRGVTSIASLQGGLLKSVHRPTRSRLRMFVHPMSVTRFCCLRITTVSNCLNIALPNAACVLSASLSTYRAAFLLPTGGNWWKSPLLSFLATLQMF